VVLTTTSGITLLLTYAFQLYGYQPNPYTGILIFLILPVVFVAGLVLIPFGIYRQFRKERRLGRLPLTYPTVDFSQRELRPATAGPCTWIQCSSAERPATKS
jgi:hypothetical protein